MCSLRPDGSFCRPRPARSAVLPPPARVIGSLADRLACSGSGQAASPAGPDTSPREAERRRDADISGSRPPDSGRRGRTGRESVSSPLHINDMPTTAPRPRDQCRVGRSSRRSSGATATPVGDPGDLTTSPARRRRSGQRGAPGVYVATADGCRLARRRRHHRRRPALQMSEDERWVVSWPAEGASSPSETCANGTRRVEGTTTGAVVLGQGLGAGGADHGDGSRGRGHRRHHRRVIGRTNR